MIKPEFDVNQVTIESRETAYKGFFSIEKIRLRHALFKGGESGLMQRELFERGEAVALLLFDAARETVVLTEQFRIGALQDGTSPWLLELVAGMVEEGESPEQVAVREAQEESGCVVDKLLPVCQYWVSPGGSSERLHVFCAGVNSAGMGGIFGLQEENEDIKVHVLSAEDAFAAVRNGRINNAATIIALQWLQLNYARVKEELL